MKNKKYNIEEEVEKTMESMDKVQRVEGNPFLFTRIQERLRQGESENVVTTHSRVPIWQLAMVVGLFLINGLALMQSGYFDMESTVAVEEVADEDWLVSSEEEDLNYISWND